MMMIARAARRRRPIITVELDDDTGACDWKGLWW
jgi:hypothetical protein